MGEKSEGEKCMGESLRVKSLWVPVGQKYTGERVSVWVKSLRAKSVWVKVCGYG